MKGLFEDRIVRVGTETAMGFDRAETVMTLNRELAVEAYALIWSRR